MHEQLQCTPAATMQIQLTLVLRLPISSRFCRLALFST